MDNLIISQQQQGVLSIQLNRFDKLNALTEAMYSKLCDLFDHASQSDDIHCVLIHGNEQCFCAGNDLHDFIQVGEGDDLEALRFVSTLANFNKPIIAAVAGAAVGIGTTLLLHCDMVFAATNSKFKLPFTQLGLCPEAGSSFLLTQRLGANKAFELLVLGDTFSAEKAFELGLVNQVLTTEKLITTATACAYRIAKLPLDAVLTSRQLIRQASLAQTNQAIRVEGEQFKRLVKTDTCKAILNQFFQ